MNFNSSIWLIALLLIVVTNSHASTNKKKNNKKLHIVLLADEKDHGPAGNSLHDYPLWQKRWEQLLRSEDAFSIDQVKHFEDSDEDKVSDIVKKNVQVSGAWHWPSAKQFRKADLIVAYCYLQWTNERLKQVSQYLEKGGGLVLIHSATWTKPQPSSKVSEVVGVGGFELFRHGTVKLEVIAVEHPICAGLPKTIFLENDETYWPPTPIMENVTVLATSMEGVGARGSTPKAAQPAFWCYELGKGRVFGCVPGHNLQTFENPAFRKLLFQGMNWAVGKKENRNKER